MSLWEECGGRGEELDTPAHSRSVLWEHSEPQPPQRLREGGRVLLGLRGPGEGSGVHSSSSDLERGCNS